jgi:hypothetical protein
MGELIYSLCAVAAGCCAWLLFRAYRRSTARLLLWSSVCFAMLALNNALVVVDLRVVPTVDLFVLRNVAALLAVGVMLYGLVWDAR